MTIWTLKLSACIGALALLMFGTGCAVLNPGGFGLSSKIEAYAIDERAETSNVSTRPMSLKCRWLGKCESEGAVHGS